MATSKGTGYTNLQQYLAANNGNRLGNVINTGIGDVVGGGQKEFENQRNTFSTGLKGEQERLGGLFGGAQNTLNTLSTNPNVSDQQVNQFHDAQNAQYKGPTGFKDEEGLQRKVTNINDVSNLAGSRAGRGELLRTFINAPNYTRNKQDFDTLFLGNDVDTKLRKARQSGEQLGRNISSGVEGAKQQADVARAGVQPKVQQINTNARTIGSNLQNVLQQRAKDKQTQSDAFRERLSQEDLGGLAGYGVKPTDVTVNQLNAMKHYGAGDSYWSNLVNPTYAQNINPAGVANENEKAQSAALTRLLSDPTYQAYTTGDAYIAPTVSLTPDKANAVAVDKYNQVNQMTLPELAQYNPEIDSVVKGWLNSPVVGSVNNYTLPSILNLMRSNTFNDFDRSVFGYDKLAALESKLKQQFGIGATPQVVAPAVGSDTGYIPPRS